MVGLVDDGKTKNIFYSKYIYYIHAKSNKLFNCPLFALSSLLSAALKKLKKKDFYSMAYRTC